MHYGSSSYTVTLIIRIGGDYGDASPTLKSGSASASGASPTQT
jgi:hypothetical protein